MPVSRLSRAARLLDQLLLLRCFSEEELSSELVIGPRTLADYRDGRVPMPLERQLCLALLTIEKVPRCARLGRQLRAQVAAAIAYETHATKTHDGPPINRIRVAAHGQR